MKLTRPSSAKLTSVWGKAERPRKARSLACVVLIPNPLSIPRGWGSRTPPPKTRGHSKLASPAWNTRGFAHLFGIAAERGWEKCAKSKGNRLATGARNGRLGERWVRKEGSPPLLQQAQDPPLLKSDLGFKAGRTQRVPTSRGILPCRSHTPARKDLQLRRAGLPSWKKWAITKL